MTNIQILEQLRRLQRTLLDSDVSTDDEDDALAAAIGYYSDLVYDEAEREIQRRKGGNEARPTRDQQIQEQVELLMDEWGPAAPKEDKS